MSTLIRSDTGYVLPVQYRPEKFLWFLINAAEHRLMYLFEDAAHADRGALKVCPDGRVELSPEIASLPADAVERILITAGVLALPLKCPAVNPETDRACVLDSGHSGKHQTHQGRWFGESEGDQ